MQHYKNSVVILCGPVAGHAVQWEVTALAFAFPSNREPTCVSWLDPGGQECCLLLQGPSGGREGHYPLPGRKTHQWTHHAHLCKCTQSWAESDRLDILWRCGLRFRGHGCGLGCSHGCAYCLSEDHVLSGMLINYPPGLIKHERLAGAGLTLALPHRQPQLVPCSYLCLSVVFLRKLCPCWKIK